MFPYYGSKWNIARHYPSPTTDLVIEPFAGGAGYASFYDAKQVLLIDKDPIIAGLWSYLIKASIAEITALPEMPEVGDSVDNYQIPQEAKWLIGFWLNRGSASPKKSRTAYSARTDRAQLNWSARAKERIASQLHMLAGWRSVEGSYDVAPPVHGTWFIDPPYGNKGRYYRVPFTDGFDQLGDWCCQRHGLIIVCEGPGATWLPFEPVGSFKSSMGRTEEWAYIHLRTTLGLWKMKKAKAAESPRRDSRPGLAYRPKPKLKPAKRRKCRATKARKENEALAVEKGVIV